MKECHEAYQQALSDRSNKHSRAQVNSVQDDDKEENQEEEEQAAVNLVSNGDSRPWKRNVLDQTRGRALHQTLGHLPVYVNPTSSLVPGPGVA